MRIDVVHYAITVLRENGDQENNDAGDPAAGRSNLSSVDWQAITDAAQDADNSKQRLAKHHAHWQALQAELKKPGAAEVRDPRTCLL